MARPDTISSKRQRASGCSPRRGSTTYERSSILPPVGKDFKRTSPSSARPPPARPACPGVVDVAQRKRVLPPPLPARCSKPVPAAAAAEPVQHKANEALKCGTKVLVRTRLYKTRDGKWLVRWLSAVVVSAAAKDGGYEVVYDGKFPPEDPFTTVTVASCDVKLPSPAGAVSTATP